MEKLGLYYVYDVYSMQDTRVIERLFPKNRFPYECLMSMCTDRLAKVNQQIIYNRLTSQIKHIDNLHVGLEPTAEKTGKWSDAGLKST